MSRVIHWFPGNKMTRPRQPSVYSQSEEHPLSITLEAQIQLCLIRLESITSCHNSKCSITFLYSGRERV